MQNGKAVLQATTSSMRPIFRETKPISLEDGLQIGAAEERGGAPAAAASARAGAASSNAAAGAAPAGAPAAEPAVAEVGEAPLRRSSAEEPGVEANGEQMELALDLMMMLNSENLVRLKQQFAKYKDELDVHEFCSVMQQHLAMRDEPTQQEQIALIANLSELFAQVDVNGDEQMEWEELTSFIVEALNGGDLANPLPKYRAIEPV